MNKIFLAYKTLDEVNTTKGIYTFFTYTAEIVPIFIPLLLFAFMSIATLGSYFASVRLTNRGDLPASFASGGFVTAILATIISLIPGLINLPTLVITYGIAILGIIWLFFSRD